MQQVYKFYFKNANYYSEFSQIVLKEGISKFYIMANV